MILTTNILMSVAGEAAYISYDSMSLVRHQPSACMAH